jgi:hypothetical protein
MSAASRGGARWVQSVLIKEKFPHTDLVERIRRLVQDVDSEMEAAS